MPSAALLPAGDVVAAVQTHGVGELGDRIAVGDATGHRHAVAAGGIGDDDAHMVGASVQVLDDGRRVGGGEDGQSSIGHGGVPCVGEARRIALQQVGGKEGFLARELLGGATDIGHGNGHIVDAEVVKIERHIAVTVYESNPYRLPGVGRQRNAAIHIRMVAGIGLLRIDGVCKMVGGTAHGGDKDGQSRIAAG